MLEIKLSYLILSYLKTKGFPQFMSLLKSQDGHILCKVNFGWTK